MKGLVNKNDFIETVQMKGLTISLIASGDHTEIIHHKLEAHTRWALEPEEGWTALEYLFILSGELTLTNKDGPTTLKAGDSFYRSPVNEHFVFQSTQPTEFLYISSQPVFHRYSNISRDLVKLAVSIEKKDGYTSDHCARISKMSMQVGEKLGLNSRQLLRLNMASFFHDIGKIKIPLEILLKPGKLTNKEWEIMKLHTTYGREVLQETKLPLLIDAGRIVEQHHERYDGKGYPFGLKKTEIDIEAFIISVVDSYDAMITDRPYSKAMPKEDALTEIVDCRGTMYSPDVVDAFISIQHIL
ncbi:HD domain-containing phosphohydrolase [Metabacillus sp. HB246100]|uniref:HD domain-containing phosphohydrolase n=1 Tax=Bacillus weihaiensis TaxID=1547283 RepID=UPI0023560B9A|nr:HD domain-containing phosphohydrolase [Bacillus weihaiensis]